MKKLIFALTLGTCFFLGTSVDTFAQQHGAGEVSRMVVLCGKTGQAVNADVVLNK